MSLPSQQSSRSLQRPAPELGRRAKVACKACHRRRVKCDAAESQPCWHCRLRNTPCEFIVSRRGKYARRKTANTRASDVQTSSVPAKPTSPTVGRATSQTILDDTHSQQSASIGQPRSPPITVDLPESQGTSDSVNEGAEMLYARMAEPESTQASLNLFPSNVRSFYMGESFSLAFIVQSLSSNPAQRSGPKLHYPIPNTVAEHQNSPGQRNPSDPATLAYLNMFGAFEVPSNAISDKLIRTFFESFHPAFPVFDRREFCALYQQGQVPILVLQTIYFLSLTICSEDLVRRAGFADRHSARRTFYLRAKALYDMDYEKSKVKLTAVLFLLGFWWETPEDQKDTWHWLGAAISLAQTLGMHRSTANSGMSLRHRSMWKRIWWSIYVRDRHAAAALGRPCRIRDEDCDIEMLNQDDFLADHEYDSDLLGDEHDYHCAYAVEMAKLAVIMGRLLCHGYAPHGSTLSGTSQDLDQELCGWEVNLPPVLRRQPAPDSFGAPFWSSMLYAVYYNCQILLCRPQGPVALPANHAFGAKARIAADSITRTAEDLLAAGTLMRGQLHLVPAIFAALSIHALIIRGNEGVQKQLAENRARQCILAMGELARGWPVAGWILRLFIKLMNRLTGPGSSLSRRASPQREVHPESHLLMNQQTAQSMSNSLPYMPVEGGWICGGEEEETNQLMSDIIWAPNQGGLDFDMMFRNTQLNDLFPFTFG